MSPGHTLDQTVALNHARPESCRNIRIKTQCYPARFKSCSALLPRSPQPLASDSLVSPTPVSLSHTATAFNHLTCISSPSHPHASPSLLSTDTMKSYWATTYCSAGRVEPLFLAHSAPSSSLPYSTSVFTFIPIRYHLHIHHRPDAGPHP
jgi:hypothetical protein